MYFVQAIFLLLLLLTFLFHLNWCLMKHTTEQLLEQNSMMKDEKHGIKMGQVFHDCDDARTNLQNDWDGSPINYTCYRKFPFKIDTQIKSMVECENLSPDYMPQHFCMQDLIHYNHSLPTHGDHRPLWPVFGEYLFVPPQRWLHNIEHGAIVMIYHPCAHPMMIDKLRKLVTNCIRKHVITPDSYRLTNDRPLALIAWGCRLQMNHVDSHEIINFIRQHALHGPEGKYSKEGQFDKNLLKRARVPVGSSIDDDILCPFNF